MCQFSPNICQYQWNWINCDIYLFFTELDRDSTGQVLREGALRTLNGDGVIVDALLGYNQLGAPEGSVGDLVEVAEESRLPVISLDVPTGFYMETG